MIVAGRSWKVVVKCWKDRYLASGTKRQSAALLAISPLSPIYIYLEKMILVTKTIRKQLV